jgi:hypothetical protein
VVLKVLVVSLQIGLKSKIGKSAQNIFSERNVPSAASYPDLGQQKS